MFISIGELKDWRFNRGIEMTGNINDEQTFEVTVTMTISKNGKEVETKKIDFGTLKESQTKGLADVFAMMAANIEYIKKLAPQFEKLGQSKPTYLR